MGSNSINHAATLQTALSELRLRRAEIASLRRARNEPIAVVGMACRFPGKSSTPELFWELLDRGGCAVGDIPRSRWDAGAYYDPDPGRPGKMAVRRGGFLDGVSGFDAAFFGISPREAATMDPQQRLLLEVAWEAVENANIAASGLYRRPVGVFAGITCFDHAMMLSRQPEGSGAYAGTGSSLNTAAGRVSYALGLQGPCLAVDTACSSSLVGLHLACQSLRAGECELALAGGVHLILSADVMVTFSQARMLSPDGLSKSFDASADGYGRGEGCGVVVLKRLADAERDGDCILGVIRGTAVGHSGPSAGLTVPSAHAQGAVIAQALAQAGVEPGQVSYVEAHGTGTSLGDPIEIEAMGAAYGRDRTAPLITGSVKTNIGHLEPASGIAGLIKLLLAFRHGRIPRTLHFRVPNPHIAWDEIPVRVGEAVTPFAAGTGPRICGLSAFGFSGTNAHAVIEAPLVVATLPEAPVGPYQLTVSAKTAGALRTMAASYAERLKSISDVEFPHFCAAAGRGREAFAQSLSIVARNAVEARERLLQSVPVADAEPLPLPVGSAWKSVRLPNYPFERQEFPLAGAAETPERALGLYTIEWAALPLPAPVGAVDIGEWLLIGSAELLAARVAELGGRLRHEQDGMAGVRHAVLVSPTAEETLRIAQSAAKLSGARPRLWVVLPPGDDIRQGAVAGLAKVIFLEHPELAGAVIESDGTTEAIAAEILAGSGEDHVVIRDGARWVPRLQPMAARSQVKVAFPPDKTYLITGGFGALGGATALWMGANGARRIVLMGRRGAAGPEAERMVAALRAAGVDVRCERADVTCVDAVRAVIHSIPGGIHGVIHAAGIPGYRAVDEIEADELCEVMRPKMEGAWALHEATLDTALDFFVCFSSIASVWGSRGQAHYAAANRALDWLAAYRRKQGLPALTVNWGPWAGGGMTSPEAEALLRRAGVVPLEPERALAALGQLMGGVESQVVAAEMDWPLFRGSYEARGKKPLLERLEAPAEAVSQATTGQLAMRLEGAAPHVRRAIVVRFVQDELCQVLQLGERPELDQGFFDMGMDSLLAMEFRSRLEAGIGRALPATLVFEFPNTAAVADHLLQSALAAPAAVGVQGGGAQEPIAIVGMGCRFPGGARDPESFWRLLRDGVDGITEVPAERWNIDDYYDATPDAAGKMYSRHGGFLDGVDQFDPGFFRISAREAAIMDPQHRLLLEVSWQAIEDAGIGADRLRGSDTGVYVGLTTNDYAHLQMREGGAGGVDSYFFTGNPLNTAAGRISYTLGLQGPAVAMDTACSSSLVAIHQACQALRGGECDMALAGGVNLILAPETTVAVCRTRAISPGGRCKPFDASADGFVRSEGCGVLVLKTLTRARADGDRILAVIRGSAVNQDGASSGFTVPNGKAQEKVIRKALGGVLTPDDVDYVEAHGTGTQLGDPVEAGALAAVFGGRRNGRVKTGSAKSNIGHTEAAAGVAGVIKMVLALREQMLPASLHVNEPNPLIAWDRIPVELCREATAWPAGERVRRCGISAFGASGTNAHLILEEAPETARAEAGEAGYPLVFSAKSDATLQELGRLHLAALQETADEDFPSYCYTSAAGRSPFRNRAAVAARTRQEAIATLRRFVDGGSGVVLGDAAEPDGAGIPAALTLEEKAERYVRGGAFAWENGRRRVALPHYPFQRSRMWFKKGLETMQKVPENANAASGSRRNEILARLKSFVAGLLHADVSQVDETTPFLEMGADSLVMVDVMQAVESEYGIKLAIRNFFEDLSTLSALANYVAENLPVPMAAPPAPAPVEMDGGGSVLERVIADQNRMVQQVIAQQMELLRQMGTVSAAKPAVAAAVLPAPPAPVAASEKVAPLLPWGSPAPARTRGITEAQRAHLDALSARYASRTKRSKEMVQASRRVLADSRATVGFRLSTKEMLYPIVGTESKGSRIRDVDGNEYIDFTMGFGVHLFGHMPEFIMREVEAELRRGVELGARSDLAGEVAGLFTELTGHERVAFSNTGTEAVMAAMRLARACTGKKKIVIFNHSYHGHSDGTLAAPRVVDGKTTTVAVAPGVPDGMVENTVVLEYGTSEALAEIRRMTGELAAVMVEPVQSRNPALQPAEFLRQLRQITADCGAALIFDEMITGLRVHSRGAQGWFGIEADLATYGKIAGGGLPIGLVAGSARFMDGIDGGHWQYGDDSFPAAERTAFGGTFCQHPLSLAASRAVLRHLLADGGKLQARLNRRTEELAVELNAYFESESVPVRVSHFGSMFRFEFSVNLDLFFYHLLEKGIYIWEWRTCFLSTAHSEDDIAAFVGAIRETIQELRSGEWLAPAAKAAAAVRAPLSEAQRQLWLLDKMDRTGSLAYQIHTAIAMDGELRPGRLRQAMRGVVRRHEALRTTVVSGEEQCIWPDRDVDFAIVDLTDGPESLAMDRFREWCALETAKEMDLAQGPLFRVRLARLAAQRHVLLLTAHHIIADGGTMALVAGEFAAAYAGEPGEAGAPMQFREFIAECAERLREPEMEVHRQFWLGQCEPPSPPLQLPADRPRPATGGYRGGRVTTAIDAALTAKVRRFSRGNGCTLYVSLLSGFQVLLHRLTGQNDLVSGMPVSGRPSRRSQSVAGYCTHLLPLRNRFREEATFTEFVRRNRQYLLDALEHQEYPFAELLREIGRMHGGSREPLVRVVFNLEPAAEWPSLGTLQLHPVALETRYSGFDLSVNVTDQGSELVLDCDYSSDLFDVETVADWLASFETLLRSAMDAPETPLSRLPLLSGERRRAVLALGAGPVAPVNGQGFLTLFAEQVRRRPERTAIVDGTRRWSYAELDGMSNGIAAALAQNGAARENCVGICMSRGAGLIAGLLGIWKTGAAYVPLDPAYPKSRLEFMLEDAAVSVVVTDRASAGALPAGGQALVFADEVAATDVFAGQGAELDDLAYVIYTSGSTGRPKGVAITQRNVAGLLQWAQCAYDERQLQGTLFATSVSFDVSVFEIFVPLACGGTLIVAENVLALAGLPAAAEVTLLSTVPSAMPDLLRAAALPSSLTTIQLAGERLGRGTVQRIYRQTGVQSVLNIYGPTEDTVYSTGTQVAVLNELAPSIGRPLLNKTAYVLDRHMEPVPPGVCGDLYLGGGGLARGYLNRPELTAERFVDNPFGAGRLYKTGDLARFRRSGEIEFIGRDDQQIKLRGFRIELGEVEAVLARFDAVNDAAVILHETESGAQLIGYVTSDRTEEDVLRGLRPYLAERLPAHMQPAQIVVCKEFPALPNGKMDRSRLPLPGVRTHYTPPRDERERRVAEVWQEATGVARIGVFDNFFEIGGNSLSATRVAGRIREVLGFAMELRTIFAYPTIDGFAREMARRENRVYGRIGRAAPADSYVLTPVQRRFWVQEYTGQGSGALLPACFEISGRLDTGRFQQAFETLIARHEILRTVFRADGGEPRQVVLPVDESRISMALSQAASEAEAAELVREMGALPMDLARGPLVRASLIRLSDVQHLCACAMHHIITDGVSIEILLRECLAIYDSLVAGETAKLTPPEIDYKDYAEWLQGYLSGPEGVESGRYWADKLGGGLQPLGFPSDVPRALAGEFQRASYRFRVSAAPVTTLARTSGTTPFIVLMSVLKSLLYRKTGSEDLVVGSPVAGRVRPELETQIGPYLNIVALRTAVSGADRFDHVLEKVRETTLDAYANQLYPFERIVEQLAIPRIPGRNPVFDVGMTLQNQKQRARGLETGNLFVTEKVFPELESAAAEALTDLWFLAEDEGGEYAMQIVYNGALFRQTTIGKLAEGFRLLLDDAARDSGVAIRGLRMDESGPPVRSGERVKIDLAFRAAARRRE